MGHRPTNITGGHHLVRKIGEILDSCQTNVEQKMNSSLVNSHETDWTDVGILFAITNQVVKGSLVQLNPLPCLGK